MNRIDNRSRADESIVYRTRCHWAIFLGPALVIIIGGLALNSQGLSAIVLIAFGLLWGVFSHVYFRRSDIVLTRKRLVIKAGFPLLREYDIPLDDINAVDYYQPTLGSMLDFGKVIIVDKRRNRCVIRFVSSPGELVTQVRQQIKRVQAPAEEIDYESRNKS